MRPTPGGYTFIVSESYAGLPSPRVRVFAAVAMMLLGATAGTLSYLVIPASYSAVGSVLLTAPTGTDPDRYVADQMAIATSADVSRSAASRARTTTATVERSVAVTQLRLSNVMQFIGTSVNPVSAVRLVSAAQLAYLSSPVVKAQAQVSGPGTRAVVVQTATFTGRSGPGLSVDILVGALTGLLLVVIYFVLASRRYRFSPLAEPEA